MLSLVVALSACVLPTLAEQPNVIFVVVDDLGKYSHSYFSVIKVFIVCSFY